MKKTVEVWVVLLEGEVDQVCADRDDALLAVEELRPEYRAGVYPATLTYQLPPKKKSKSKPKA